MSTDDQIPLIRIDFAGLLAKGISMMGGNLLLTPDELIFVPLIDRDTLLITDSAARVSKELHDWVAHPQTFINAAAKRFADVITIPLEDINSVEPSRRFAVRISWQDKSKRVTTEFAISATRLSPMWSRRNVAVRDALLAELQKARRAAG